MALTDTQIRQAKPQQTDSWLTDEKGLRLLVKPNAAKYWRLKYRYLGKQKTWMFRTLLAVLSVSILK